MSPNRRSWTLTRAAVRDLEDIWRHTFERWSVEQADSYHNSMIAVFTELAAGHRRERKIAVPNHAYFYTPSGSHNIFFREEKTRIIIVRILHNRMDPSRHL